MPGILCEHCTAVCCRYIALPIDTPQERSDFDDIRWYLLHEGISVFVEDGPAVQVQRRCRVIGSRLPEQHFPLPQGAKAVELQVALDDLLRHRT